VHPLFIDPEKGYDSVRREILYHILTEYGKPMTLFRLIKMSLNGTFSNVCIGTNLTDAFPNQNGLKQGDALSPLPFHSALQYSNRKVHESREGLELDGTHHLLDYAYNMNMLGENTAIIRKSAKALLQANREVGLEVNTEKTKYMVVSHHKYAEQTTIYRFLMHILKK
jgi:hypothetical protein